MKINQEVKHTLKSINQTKTNKDLLNQILKVSTN